MSAAEGDAALERERPVEMQGNPRADVPRSRAGWFVLVAAVALLVAYDLFEAIANLSGVVAQVNAYNAFADENGLTLARIPWVVLIANLVVSPAAFVVALSLGRGRSLVHRVLFLVAGLAAAAALSLSLAAFA